MTDTFSSRWVETPEHVTEMPGGLPAGFRAAGVACGLKPSGAPDLGLLVSDAVDTVSAARFTRSGVLAAPVLLTQERCQLTGIRAVVAESFEQARHAALTLRPEFDEAPGPVDPEDPAIELERPEAKQLDQGDLDRALQEAAFTVDATYRTPPHGSAGLQEKTRKSRLPRNLGPRKLLILPDTAARFPFAPHLIGELRS